jgi:23S rRNA (uridine2552-2'-O)-methyltransferase
MSRNKSSQRVKSARGRKTSSTRWLQRQINDHYVDKARRHGYRSRAAFKLIEIDGKLGILKPGQLVVDLGAAPGGWSQVASERGCEVIALDILEIDELPQVKTIRMDFIEEEAPNIIKDFMQGRLADLVLSDMSPNTTGHKATDHLRIVALAESAYEFAAEVLKPGGAFVAKVFQGGAEKELLSRMKREFTKVRHIKPPSSRKESAEQYVVATDYRGDLR